MNTVKVILIDDERLAREEIKRHLAIYPDFEIIGEAANADEAENMINSLHPDFIFLDIQMPGRSGFDLLESLTNVPNVIFTTAFDKYAVQAFEVNAIDYLVKPIREERFAKAMMHIQFRQQEKEKNGNTVTANQTLFIKEGTRLHFIQLNEIYLIESHGNYARVHYSNNKVHIKRSLNQMEAILDTKLFFRISRTTIINTNYIQQIKYQPKGRLSIQLQTGELLIASTRQSAAFKNRKTY